MNWAEFKFKHAEMTPVLKETYTRSVIGQECELKKGTVEQLQYENIAESRIYRISRKEENG